MKREKMTILFVIAVTLMVNACGGKQQTAAERLPLAKDVQVETVTRTAVEDDYQAVGTVKSKTSTTLSAKIMGYVTAVRAQEGEAVRAGQVVIEIENREALTQLEKARAGLREAQEASGEVEQSMRAAEAAKAAAEAHFAFAAATFKRYSDLLERRSVSRQEFEDAQAKYRIAEAEADRAAKMLLVLAAKKQQILAKIEQAKSDIVAAQVQASYARISSPINGIVTAKHANVGQMATPGAPLVTIEDSSIYRLEAALEESQIARVKIGDAAHVMIDALDETGLEGRVAEIIPAADPASRSFTVKIELPANGLQAGLRSGLFGKAQFAGAQKQALTVRQSAIIERGQLIGVYVVDEAGIARLRLIKTGKTYGDRTEILSGLNEGEQIAVGNVATIADGARIR